MWYWQMGKRIAYRSCMEPKRPHEPTPIKSLDFGRSGSKERIDFAYRCIQSQPEHSDSICFGSSAIASQYSAQWIHLFLCT